MARSEWFASQSSQVGRSEMERINKIARAPWAMTGLMVVESVVERVEVHASCVTLWRLSYCYLAYLSR